MLNLMGRTVKVDQQLVDAARQEAAQISSSAPPHEDAAASVDVPGYDIIRRIGSGGQGTVFEAVQKSTSRHVALKVIRAQADQPSHYRRTEREVRLLARLHHPHLVTVYDSGTTADCFYFAMQLVDGQRLDEYVTHRSLQPRQIVELFIKICDAVLAAHQRGVIHRDIKPANILVDAQGAPHVLDFGLAKLHDHDEQLTQTGVTQAGQFLGTIAWASPEQVQGNPEDVDIRTDIYSLGVVLYELLTGVPPYDTSHSLHGATENVLKTAPLAPGDLNRAVPGDVETITLRCLAKQPQRRYGSVGELVADLRRYLDGQPIEARRDSRLYVLRKTLIRHRLLAGVAMLAVTCGIGFGVVMTVMYGQVKQAHAEAQQEVVELREELQALKAELTAPSNWTSAFNSARTLKQLDPEEGWDVMRAAWSEMAEAEPKQQLLKAAYVAQHPYLAQILHLGVTDAAPAVQKWAFDFLRSTVLQDFASDYNAYERWRTKYGALMLEDITLAAGRSFAARLNSTTVAQRIELVKQIEPSDAFRKQPVMAQVAHETGLVDIFLELLVVSELKDNDRSEVAKVLGCLGLDAKVLNDRIVPLIVEDDSVRRAALSILGDHAHAAAVPAIVLQMKAEFDRSKRNQRFQEFASALAKIGDVSVIPDLIEIIDRDNTYNTVYMVGYFGLGKLTGVKYDESHDGAWWRDWWQRNHNRFSMPADRVAPASPADRSKAAKVTAPFAPATRPEQSLLAGGNPNQRYFLIGPGSSEQAEEGYGLLLVLPGGDGGPDFKTFVHRIANNAVPQRMLVAQLVAPQWSADQAEQIVWPTGGLPFEGMKFTTEAFIESVISDVKARYVLAEDHVFAMGWSSGGPPVYAASVTPGSALRGAFVIMSVFKPDQFPENHDVAGKSFYILHSPQDFIAMRFPENAQKFFADAGARATLVTYDGGHGWHGDVYGNIRDAVNWLAQ